MKYCAFRPGLAALAVCAMVLGITGSVGRDVAYAANRTLQVSSLPISGVPITASLDGDDPIGITTPYSTALPQESTVILTAPAKFQHRPFVAWWLNSADNVVSTDPHIEFDLSSSGNYIAVYGSPVYTLNVTSSPDEGIEFLNEDIVVLATPYEREFDTETPYEAIINAPVSHNGKPFSRWLLNGEVISTLHVINIMMDDDYTLEAQYGSGAIKCKIQPKAARKKKARWRVDGGEWLKKGVTVEDLLVGDHLLEWKPVPGFVTPNPRVVPVSDGVRHTIRGRYFPVK